MSLIKFGKYFGDVPEVSIGADLWLDGIDGFDDQSLWNYKIGDRLIFIINPDEKEHILQHKLIQVEIQKDTGTNDYADSKIISIDTLDNFFHRKPNLSDNDFLEHMDNYSFIWSKALENKMRHPKIGYRKFEIDFLSYTELNEVISKGQYNTVRDDFERKRIYAEILPDKSTIRVVTVGDNIPESCFLYDIHDTVMYKKVVAEKISKSYWIDEKDWWTMITK